MLEIVNVTNAVVTSWRINEVKATVTDIVIKFFIIAWIVAAAVTNQLRQANNCKLNLQKNEICLFKKRVASGLSKIDFSLQELSAKMSRWLKNYWKCEWVCQKLSNWKAKSVKKSNKKICENVTNISMKLFTLVIVDVKVSLNCWKCYLKNA